MELLNIKDLNISFTQYDKGMRQTELNVIRSLDVTVNAGEMVAVVGSSGSGKSLLAHAILGLLPYNASIKGDMAYCGSELTQERIEKLRGNEIVMVPQSIAYLDPLMKIGPQIRKGRKDGTTKKKLRDIFSRYELKEDVQNLYPFELSGGMNRRILISTALIEEPRLVNAGCTVEEAKACDFEKEETLRHPYTKALWRAMPMHGFQTIEGTQPYAKDMPEGCPFSPRCQSYTKECVREVPLRHLRDGRVRCLHAR